MKQISLEKIFNKGEILYLQGASTGASLKALNEQTKNTARRNSRNLEWFADHRTDKDGNDVVNMPIVMIMFSPLYNIVSFQGEEAYPFLNLFELLDLPKPSKEDYNKACRDIIGMINGIPPKHLVLKKMGYWKDNFGITQLTKRRLNLKKENTQFRYIPPELIQEVKK